MGASWWIETFYISCYGRRLVCTVGDLEIFRCTLMVLNRQSYEIKKALFRGGLF
jgi:hypothetical protein